MEEGGFVIVNETGKKQFVQVVADKGNVGVFKRDNTGITCEASLDGQRANRSTICELLPHERLYVDLDFAKLADASGTYQIEVGKK